MSQKIKEHYNSYNRFILEEFMSKEELDEMDKNYTQAKIQRLIRKLTEKAKGQEN